MKKYYSGSITIYFVFAIIFIISVIMSVTELAKMNGQKLYLQIATDSALDSMASLYHRKLYNFYNVYGIEYKNEDLLTAEYLSYINPYFIDDGSQEYINNWYQAYINERNINLDYKLLIEDTYLEQEVIKFMKYDIVGKILHFLGNDINIKKEQELSTLLDNVKEIQENNDKSEIYSIIFERYFDFVDDIEKLERYGKDIKKYINEANRDIAGCTSISVSGSLSNAKNVQRKIENIHNSINDLIDNLYSFKTKMDEFRLVVIERKNDYEMDVLSNQYEYTDDIKQFILEEFAYYISYVDSESVMNMQVQTKIGEANSLLNTFSGYKRIVNDLVSDLIRVENELDYERSQHGEDRDNDYIRDLNDEKDDIEDSLSEFFKDYRDEVRDIHIEDIDMDLSTEDHIEEKNLLKKLVDFRKDLLLDLVLDSERKNGISNAQHNIEQFDVSSDTPILSIDKILLGEYSVDKFNYFDKEKSDEKTKSESDNLEVEYLINGKEKDIDNFKSIVNKILAIRIAMNVLSIYKSAEKRREARSFAYITFGGFSRLLAETMFLLIITAWGTAQGIADVKKLLNNHSVNLIHDDLSWTVDIERILDIARSNSEINSITDDENDRGLALFYKDYLRLFLIITKQKEINSRMVNLINKNIKNNENTFDMSKIIFSLSVNNTFHCKHLFTNIVFVDAKDIKLYNRYKLLTHGYIDYVGLNVK